MAYFEVRCEPKHKHRRTGRYAAAPHTHRAQRRRHTGDKKGAHLVHVDPDRPELRVDVRRARRARRAEREVVVPHAAAHLLERERGAPRRVRLRRPVRGRERVPRRDGGVVERLELVPVEVRVEQRAVRGEASRHYGMRGWVGRAGSWWQS